MKVSTRGRYALRLMIDLAHHRNEGYVSLKEISARQDITVRYLEQIIAILLKAGFVQSFRGKAGGYRLSRHPREYTTEEILKLTEGSLLPISCTAPHENPCPRAAGSRQSGPCRRLRRASLPCRAQPPPAPAPCAPCLRWKAPEAAFCPMAV